LESQEDDYQDRKDRAYYLNFCDEVCETYTNYIMREKIQRADDEALAEFRKDVDNRGTDIDSFMKKVSYQSSIYGHVFIIVDTPEVDPDKTITKKAEKSEGIRPTCTIVPPTRLIDWSIDGEGDLNWVLIEQDENVDFDPTLERVEQKTYKLISKEKWEVFDEEGNILDGRSGTNELGEVFLVACYHKDINLDMVGESLIKDISYVNRIIFNWCSCIDEMIERQTFSQLIIPDDGSLHDEEESESPLKKISTSSVWTYPSDAVHPPDFISPDTENLRVIWEMIIAHVREIHRLAGLTGVSEDMYTAQRSGTSQQYGFLNINSSLASKSVNLQRTENAINELCYRWQGKEPGDALKPVVYPTKFDVEGLAQSMETTFAIVEREFSERMNKELLKQLSRKSLPIVTEDIRREIESEIESGDGTIAPIVTSGFGEEPGAPGRPASDAGPDSKTSANKKSDVKKSLQSSTKQSSGTKGGTPRK
jgi:hypothetical protein